MGIDAKILFRVFDEANFVVENDLCSLVGCKVFRASIIDVDRFGATHEVDCPSRYYGPGYLRGNWPFLCGVLMSLLACNGIEKVWYGGDLEYCIEEEFCWEDLFDFCWLYIGRTVGRQIWGIRERNYGSGFTMSPRKNACNITIDGDTKSLTEWCREQGISKQLVLDRIGRGWSEKDAVMKPARTYRRLNGSAKDGCTEISP